MSIYLWRTSPPSTTT
jgi:hypothetical protein